MGGDFVGEFSKMSTYVTVMWNRDGMQSSVSLRLDVFQVAAFLENLKQDFPFLLVMEYMHESLLLLRRKWCWELNDILFLQKNVFKYQSAYFRW